MRTALFLAISGFLIVLGATLLWYGNILPNYIDLYSRYSGEYQGQTNLVAMVGVILIPVGLLFFFYWLLMRSKKQKPVNLSSEPERGETAKVIGKTPDI